MSAQYTKTVSGGNSQYAVPVIQFRCAPGHYTGMTFSENLVRLRKAKGWQQEDVAELVGVAQETVSRWETGEREPRGKHRQKLADALSVAEADLFRKNEPAEFSDGAPISVQIRLPNVGALTSMFRSLLEATKGASGPDERAEMLARNFPGMFQAALSLRHRSGDDGENIASTPARVDGEDRPRP